MDMACLGTIEQQDLVVDFRLMALDKLMRQVEVGKYYSEDYILDTPTGWTYSCAILNKATIMCNLTQPHFQDKDAAREYLEELRWPNGPVCPHCGVTGAWPLKGGRAGLYRCKQYQCRKQFSVTVGTVFERSKVPLNKWLMATYLLCSSKKGVSAHQVHRTIGVTYKTAWFMCHRIREAMTNESTTPFGTGGGIVEADETYMGKVESKNKIGAPYLSQKRKIVSLVDRDTKQVRSVKVDRVTIKTVQPILRANIAREAKLMTDGATLYKPIGGWFAEHNTVNHSAGEYVNKHNRLLHTNTVENYFSVFKRGMRGTYQHCAEHHLNRYLSEFDFRYNYRVKNGYDDAERADIALKNIAGKRLTYQSSNAQQAL